MANFSVAARTLIHLGAELITSDEVAINELVKNAFDAESKRVRINVFIPISHSLIDDCLAILDNSKKEEALQDDIFHIKKMLHCFHQEVLLQTYSFFLKASLL